MLLSIIWLAVLIFDTSILRGNTYKIATRVLLIIGVYCFFMLVSLGAKHIEAPYILLGQLCTITYFSALLVLLPTIGVYENYLYR